MFYTGEYPYVEHCEAYVPNVRFPYFPPAAHPQYKSLVYDCLRTDPHARPTFEQILDRFTAFEYADAPLPATAAVAPWPAPSPPSPPARAPAPAPSPPALGAPPGVLPSAADSAITARVGVSTREDVAASQSHPDSRALLASCILGHGPCSGGSQGAFPVSLNM